MEPHDFSAKSDEGLPEAGGTENNCLCIIVYTLICKASDLMLHQYNVEGQR